VSDLPGETPAFKGMLPADKNKDGKIQLEEFPEAGMQRLFGSIDRDFGNGDGAVEEAEWDRAFRGFQNRGGLAAVRLGGRGDLTTTSILWRYTKSVPYAPSPLSYQGVVYMVNERAVLTALDRDTGEVLKQGRLPEAPGPYYASPVAADGKIYFVSEAGKVSVLKAGREWEVLASSDLGEKCYATPAIAGRRIYVRTSESLWCFSRP